jgi:hypothetical protein
VVGDDIGAIFAPLRLTQSARLRFLQSSAAAEAVEFVQRGADGVDCDLRCVAAPLASTFGHPIGALYIFQNVTALKQSTLPRRAGESEELTRLELDAAAEVTEAADGSTASAPPSSASAPWSTASRTPMPRC